MRIDIVTLFPELCDGFLSTSILGRARAKNLFEAHCHQIRDYTKNKQRQTDDYPYGGGCGMVLYAQPIADCLRAVADQCAQQSRAKQDLLRHAPLPCAGAVLVQPHQAEADDIHNKDVNHCSIHICIIPCAGAKGKRGGAYETLTTVLCGEFEK